MSSHWTLAYLLRQGGHAVVQQHGVGDVQSLAVEHHPVGVVLHLHLDPDGAAQPQLREVRVESELVVDGDDVAEVRKHKAEENDLK